MIRFPCHCKYLFEVPEELAGRQIQCPQCGRLNDVPTHDEILHLGEDGTYQMDDLGPPPPGGFADMQLAYARRKVDEQGVEIDLRLSPQEIAAAGSVDLPPDFVAGSAPPKYDPETGELIRPLAVRQTEPAPPVAIPLANTVLNYAQAGLNVRGAIWRPALQLLQPINLVVMFFVLLVHAFLLATVASLILLFFGLVVTGVGLIAHYANVIEDIAVEERDELPRFLRYFNLSDDAWKPFCHVVIAGMYSYGLSLAALYLPASRGRGLVAAALVVLGTIIFPAALLTSITSGSLSNLRPDRLLETISLMGMRYAYYVLMLALALVVYGLGILGSMLAFLLPARALPLTDYCLPVALALLILGVYLMHYFCWILALAYRVNHERFPWLFQRHVPQISGVTAARFLPRTPHPTPPKEPQGPK